MENKKIIIQTQYRRLTVIKCLMIACLLAQVFLVKSQVGTLTVISNLNGAPGAMKLSELRSVMKGEYPRWKNGTRVTVAIMKTSTPVGEKTAKVIYNMSADGLIKFLLGRVYDGNPPPVFFNSISELENYVAQNPGAIGVVDHPLENNQIKIITIDGNTYLN